MQKKERYKLTFTDDIVLNYKVFVIDADSKEEAINEAYKYIPNPKNVTLREVDVVNNDN